MRIIFILAILLLFFNCSNNSKEQQLLKELHEANKYISTLEDSLIKNGNQINYGFNKFEPISIGNEHYRNSDEPFKILVGHLAYNSKYRNIVYWVDDSTMNPENQMKYIGNELYISFDTIIPAHKKGLTKGEHQIYGKIARIENGKTKWNHWRYGYEIK